MLLSLGYTWHAVCLINEAGLSGLPLGFCASVYKFIIDIYVHLGVFTHYGGCVGVCVFLFSIVFPCNPVNHLITHRYD